MIISKYIYSKILSLVVIGVYIFAQWVFPLQSVFAQEFFDAELEQAVTWMHTNDLTRYDNVQDYRPADTLTREQAAKFFWNFALYMQKSVIKSEEECGFSDIANADYTLVSHITNSCMLGIFQWSQWLFKPFDPITRAEAMTVVVRILEWFQNENLTPRRSEYHKLARQLGITNENDVYSLDTPISRYEIALMIYRASDANSSLAPDQTQVQLNELADLLLSLWLLSN